MSKVRFDLYLDESGDFEDDRKNRDKEPSLVGGLLIPSAKVNDIYLNGFVPESIHAMEYYDKALFFRILQKLIADGGQFVIFNNEERIKVVNGDMTYLNIISEGLVQLMRNLRIEYPGDEIELSVLVANRQAVSYKKSIGSDDIIKIEQNQYYARLDEKLIIAMGRNQIHGITIQLKFGNAKRLKRLMLADIICNTYLSRNGRKKFTDDDRTVIESLFATARVYSVFENATIGNLKRLFVEARYSELLFQLCTLTNLNGIIALRNQLLKIIVNETQKERDVYFSYMSLQISQYNRKRMFAEGIKFAENYKRIILLPLKEQATDVTFGSQKDAFEKQLDYWCFDTDFYVLTMYDHLGNAGKCAEYLEICKENIGAINRSWEHIDYYFRFCLRELNCLIGQFEFETVIEKAKQLMAIFKDTKDLFVMIGAYSGNDQEVKSELLGRANGIALEAYINLLHTNPELYSEALAASDAALAEFSENEDRTRQWLYRSQLMVEMEKIDEALEALMRAHGLDLHTSNVFRTYMDISYANRHLPNVFSLLHFSNVLRLALENAHPCAAEMMKAMMSYAPFAEDINGEEIQGHPWNLILWNVSRCYRATGQESRAEMLYKHAIKLTRMMPDNITMCSFAPSMSAENLLYYMRNHPASVKQAESEYRKICDSFHKNKLPAGIAKTFPLPGDKINVDMLLKVSANYLK